MQDESSASLSIWQIGNVPSFKLVWGARRRDQSHQCLWCGLILLTGERPGFCCGRNGKYVNDPARLPPLPIEFSAFMNDPRISSYSRLLNLIFSFAALESTQEFPTFGPGPPAFVAVAGRIYHRVRPDHNNSAVRWLLYDGFLQRLPLPHADANWVDMVPDRWIDVVAQCLLDVNPFAQALQHLGSLDPALRTNAFLTIDDEGPGPEIAAVMNYENTIQSDVQPRRGLVVRRGGDNQSVSTLSRLWEPLSYPLLFPHGTLGWGINQARAHAAEDFVDGNTNINIDEDSCGKQIMYYRARILHEPRFRVFGRLANEYIVDMFSRNLETRLAYIRSNQNRLREQDAELMGEPYVPDSQNVYLPASFMGSRRWASEQISDSLAVAAEFGPPTFFCTMTCNGQWPAIQSQLRRGQDYSDLPVIVARVFKRAVTALEQSFNTMFPNAGQPLYIIHSVEFQKRGLPHVHILVKYNHECTHPDDIDSVVSAEIPDIAEDQELVRSHMMHRHPPDDRPPSKYCQRVDEFGRRTCRFGYPQPLQPKTTVDSSGRIHYRRRKPEDQWVVAHNLPLLRKFRCHLNMEVANTSHLFQYLFKYIHKVPDHTRYRLRGNADEPIDEIDDFWKARYLSCMEATWRILGFNMTRKYPSVTPLAVHLPTATNHHQYHRNSQTTTLSTLDRYFVRPQGTFVFGGQHRLFVDLTYSEYFTLFRVTKYDPNRAGHPSYFVEQPNRDSLLPLHVILRQSDKRHLARLRDVPPSRGELFYLRALLQHRPANSFLDARTVNGTLYDSYQEAATILGLFANEKEAEYGMREAIHYLKTPRQLRLLFVHLLVNDCIPSPVDFWGIFENSLQLDFVLRLPDAPRLATDHALEEIGRYLEEYGKHLANYGLPEPHLHGREVDHEQQRWGHDLASLAAHADAAAHRFNAEQRQIYDDVLAAIVAHVGLLIFVDGQAGTGKTFLVKALCDKVRSLGLIVLPTATAGYAAQHYNGGRTTHSAFKVPVNECNEMLISPIEPSSARGEFIREVSLVIWDEASMANRATLDCVDNACRRIMYNDRPFGGKIVVLLGDFRQTCPVIRRGSRAQIVNACIQKSPIWQEFVIRKLLHPIRNAEDPWFSAYVNNIGDGAGPEIPLDMLDTTTSASELTTFVFPSHILDQPLECLKRAILAPTHAQVDSYNNEILSRVDGVSRTYFAADSLKEIDATGIQSPDATLDYVARQNPQGLPNHSLTVKTNGIYRLLRNFSLDRGLVKNVRVVVTGVGVRIISVRIIREQSSQDAQDEDEILIPRITFTHVLNNGYTLLRRQFPLAPAYATTFNSCQGLNLDYVGVDLTKPVFSHGQLYTALSRIKNRTRAKIRLRPGEKSTTNVTYHEILLR